MSTKNQIALAMIGLGVIAVNPAYAHTTDFKDTVKFQAAPHFIDWTGFYLGVNGGGGWTTNKTAFDPVGTTIITDMQPQSLNMNMHGGLFGAQIGFNKQFDPLILGVEADIESTGINGSKQAIFPSMISPTDSTDSVMTAEKINLLSSMRLRFGLPFDDAMFYVTGGAALKMTASNLLANVESAPRTFGQASGRQVTDSDWGFALGAGMEYMIMKHWSLGGQYLYYKFNGKKINSLIFTDANVEPASVAVTSSYEGINVVRLTINYNFA